MKQRHYRARTGTDNANEAHEHPIKRLYPSDITRPRRCREQIYRYPLVKNSNVLISVEGQIKGLKQSHQEQERQPTIYDAPNGQQFVRRHFIPQTGKDGDYDLAPVPEMRLLGLILFVEIADDRIIVRARAEVVQDPSWNCGRLHSFLHYGWLTMR